jgi:hypothetical protein
VKHTIHLEQLEKEEGDYASIYIIKLDDDKKNELEKFDDKFENDKKVAWEFKVIYQRLNTIAEQGAEDEHFRPEGKAVKALPINAGSLLRLYCYRLDPEILIVGNGGKKPRNSDPNKNKLKDFPELEEYSKIVRAAGDELKKLIKKGIIGRDGNELYDIEPFVIEV